MPNLLITPTGVSCLSGLDSGAWLYECLPGVEAALENPSGSLIFRYEPVAQVVKELNAVIALTDTCPFSNKKFGNRYLKQFKIATTGAWIHRMVKQCRCPGKKHVALMKKSVDGKVSGTSDLKASQAYPPKFGAAIVQAWLAGEPNKAGKVAKVARVVKKPAAIPPGSPTGSSGLWTCPVQSPSLKRKLQRGADGPVAKKSKDANGPSGRASWMKPPSA